MDIQYNKKMLAWIGLGIIIVGLGIWLIFRYTGEKSLKLVSPNGKEVLEASETYQITWKARNISNVAIILIKGTQGSDVEWIVRDFSASKKSYDWQIFAWKAPRQDYKIAIFEYPWKEGNLIEYSDDFFTISGPQFASCDDLSIAEEWPFVPSDYPNLKKVFITSGNYRGNLDGLQGADRKCQEEAQEKGFDGDWKAFLGDEVTFAVDRLNLQGIIIEAASSGKLPEGNACHRLLGNNWDDFFSKLSDLAPVSQGKFGDNFRTSLANIWLGRVKQESPRECIFISLKHPPINIESQYSFTTTCYNWSVDQERIAPGQATGLPTCFTTAGARINPVGLAGLSSGIIEQQGAQFLTPALARSCDTMQKLLCVQQ